MKLLMQIIAGGDTLDMLQKSATRAKTAMGKGVKKAAMLVERTMKKIVYAGHPEHLEGDTGRLRGAIHYEMEMSGLAAEIGTNLVYAAIHEFGGTPDMAPGPAAIPARPYAQPALDQERDNISEVIGNTLYEGVFGS